jgi:hypothetical protein
MTKPIIMLAPTEERVIDPESDQRRAKLAKRVLDAGGEVMKAHPEAKAMLINLWTPRTARDIAPKHDHVHTAILTGEHEVSPEELGAFLDLIIPSLLRLRIGLATGEGAGAEAFGVPPAQPKH